MKGPKTPLTSDQKDLFAAKAIFVARSPQEALAAAQEADKTIKQLLGRS
jgi:hypothetical protein